MTLDDIMETYGHADTDTVAGYLTTRQALAIAVAVLAGETVPDDMKVRSIVGLQDILAQRGCEVHDPAAEGLPELCDIIIYG